MRKLTLVAGTVAAALAAGPAWSADIKVGLSTEPNSMDPHYHMLTPNIMLSTAVFGKLVEQDEFQNKIPGLAESWKQLAPNVWEFKLRQGVKWHDGAPFKASDVEFSFKRAGDVPNSPSSFGMYTKVIKEIEVVDDYTVRFKTAAAFPLMPDYASQIFVVSKKHGQGATTQDYNSGKAMVGTGPYKFGEWVPGDRVVYVKNPDYFGDKPEWDRVIVKPITNNSARVAALLAGDVEFIDFPAPADIPNLKKNPKIEFAQVVSNRLIYLHLDSDRDQTPMITDLNGKPLAKNPLKDVRVRKALSLAINRKAIEERIMEGLSVPAGQYMPSNVYATVPELKPDPYDLKKAKELLTEAGYPNGFALTFHAPNDRYVNDEKVAQAVAQMLTRVGIKTEVITLPSNTFFQKSSNLEYSLMLVGWTSATGEPSNPLRALLQTFNKATGAGATNRGRYSNAKFDAKVNEALNAPTREEWARLTQDATRMVVADYGIIPLHFQVNVWAMRKGLTYAARADEYTQVQSIRTAK